MKNCSINCNMIYFSIGESNNCNQNNIWYGDELYQEKAHSTRQCSSNFLVSERDASIASFSHSEQDPFILVGGHMVFPLAQWHWIPHAYRWVECCVNLHNFRFQKSTELHQVLRSRLLCLSGSRRSWALSYFVSFVLMSTSHPFSFLLLVTVTGLGLFCS